MKKALLAMFLILVLVACDNSKQTGNNGGDDLSNSDSETIKIGAIISKTGKSDIYGDAIDKGIKLAIGVIKKTKKLARNSMMQ